MSLRTKVIPASQLASDPEVAAFLFEHAAVDERGDPLNILLQREAEAEQDFWFHTEDGVQYPYFAPAHE